MPDQDEPARPTLPLRFTTALESDGCHYNDTDGVHWRVREMRRSHAVPALYFESEVAFRRVTLYPSHWENLTATELELLSHGR